MKRSTIGFALAIVLFATTGSAAPPASNTQPPKTADNTAPAPAAGGAFAATQAVLTANCMPCHATGNHKAGVDLTSYAGVMKGGDAGKIVEPGNPDKSLVVLLVTDKKKPHMPPKGKLSDADVKTISDWIKGGAKEK